MARGCANRVNRTEGHTARAPILSTSPASCRRSGGLRTPSHGAHDRQVISARLTFPTGAPPLLGPLMWPSSEKRFGGSCRLGLRKPWLSPWNRAQPVNGGRAFRADNPCRSRGFGHTPIGTRRAQSISMAFTHTVRDITGFDARLALSPATAFLPRVES